MGEEGKGVMVRDGVMVRGEGDGEGWGVRDEG